MIEEHFERLHNNPPTPFNPAYRAYNQPCSMLSVAIVEVIEELTGDECSRTQRAKARHAIAHALEVLCKGVITELQ